MKPSGIAIKPTLQLNKDPLDDINWVERLATIADSDGNIIFEQLVLAPEHWSQLATNIVAQKYFRGHDNNKESSVRALIERVAGTITEWGVAQGYFDEESAKIFNYELKYLLVHQKAAFNSPVWFNVGIETDCQVSACFIQSVDDNMEAIMDLAKSEAMIFKHGSGTGTNFSTLRSSKEPLSNGGYASGPLSFMRGFNSFAGEIRSGGAIRRAAKICILNADHPDIEEFISCKVTEEKKAWALIDAGYDGSFGGDAYRTVQYQNANNSVRVTDEFMRAAMDNKNWNLKAVTTGETLKTISASKLLDEIAEAAHFCGDPGLLFHDTINESNTLKNSGIINTCNPCTEVHLPDNNACNLSSLNLLSFHDEDGNLDLDGLRHAVSIMILAQDILIDKAIYPTDKITVNSQTYRPIGLGFANLGATLMTKGMPYDSEQGRSYAAFLMSAIQASAYYSSAMLADTMGAFAAYSTNASSMNHVVANHKRYSDTIAIPAKYKNELVKLWDETLLKGNECGYRNCAVSAIAPTGCLIGSTMITTSAGLKQLSNLGDTNGGTWQDIRIKVATDTGYETATKFFRNGRAEVIEIKTRNGYKITGTLDHKIKVCTDSGTWEWKKLGDITTGTTVPLIMNCIFGEPRSVELNQQHTYEHYNCRTIKLPLEMSEELSELLGCFMADGSLHKKGLRFHITKEDTDLQFRISRIVKKLFGIDCTQNDDPGVKTIYVNSTVLRTWWITNGFAKHDVPGAAKKESHIPKKLLDTNNPSFYKAFVRGLFSCDGCGSCGNVSVTNKSEAFIDYLMPLLLSIGIPVIKYEGIGGLSKKPVYRLTVKSYFTPKFITEVGFSASRKHESAELCNNKQRGSKDYVHLDRSKLSHKGYELANELCVEKFALEGALVVHRIGLDKIREHASNSYLKSLDAIYFDSVESATVVGYPETYDISIPTTKTYIANGFISHNTVGFMMDCDTTGIEPDIALVKYKKLVGGGTLKMINTSVARALRTLGYDSTQIDEINTYIDENDMIEGAPHLKNEHLPVFDCAYRPAKGKRYIHHSGHLHMLAAVQPLVSMGISKTINVPTDITSAEIRKLYEEAWDLELKSVSVYRDGCKRTQPLTLTDDGAKQKTTPKLIKPIRKKLPDERSAITHRFEIAGHEGYLTVGKYRDGTPGEIFIVVSKEGSTIRGLLDSFATAISLALQYGVPIKSLVEKFSYTRFEPAGFSTHPDIGYAHSVLDYIFRWLDLKFGDEQKREEGIIKAANATFLYSTDAPLCHECGSIMVRSGACHKCLNCGSTSGCS